MIFNAKKASDFIYNAFYAAPILYLFFGILHVFIIGQPKFVLFYLLAFTIIMVHGYLFILKEAHNLNTNLFKLWFPIFIVALFNTFLVGLINNISFVDLLAVAIISISINMTGWLHSLKQNIVIFLLGFFYARNNFQSSNLHS
jgi:hypothetical protein